MNFRTLPNKMQVTVRKCVCGRLNNGPPKMPHPTPQSLRMFPHMVKGLCKCEWGMGEGESVHLSISGSSMRGDWGNKTLEWCMEGSQAEKCGQPLWGWKRQKANGLSLRVSRRHQPSWHPDYTSETDFGLLIVRLSDNKFVLFQVCGNLL